MSKNSGFTLIEIMVALLILSVLTMLTAQSYKAAIDNRNFVSKEISRDAQLADTLRIMRNDIAAAFHYQNIFCKMDQDLASGGTNPNAAAAPAQNQPFTGGFGNGQQASPSGSPSPCPPAVTGFVGSTDSLYFTSLSNTRTLRDSQESDQAKVGYFLKSCKSHATKSQTQCLYRAISPLLDEKIETPGPESLLLENVEEFKLRYLGPKHEDYLDEWKTATAASAGGSDDVAKVNFPYAVEITLTILDKGNPKEKPLTQTVLAPNYFVNNPPPPGSGSPTPSNGKSLGNGLSGGG